MASEPFHREATPDEIARVLALFDSISSRLDARGIAAKLMSCSDELVTSRSRSARARGRMLRDALSMLNQDFRDESTDA